MDQTYKLAQGYKNWMKFVKQFHEIKDSMQQSIRSERDAVEEPDETGLTSRGSSDLHIELLRKLHHNNVKPRGQGAYNNDETRKCVIFAETRAHLLLAIAEKLQTVIRVQVEDERTMALLREECDRAVKASMEAKQKEKEAMSLVSGLRADVEALRNQVGVLQNALWLEKERANVAVENQTSAAAAPARVDHSEEKVSQATKLRIPVGSEPIVCGLRSTSACGKNRVSRRVGNEDPATTPEALPAPIVRDEFPRKLHRELLEPVSAGSQLEEVFASTSFWDQIGAEVLNEERSATESGGPTHMSPGEKCLHHNGKDTKCVPDLEGFRPDEMFGSGGHRSGPQDVLAGPTPFQRWKAERGIVSPGVGKILGNQRA